jgi:iron complex outermembrane receptor protein
LRFDNRQITSIENGTPGEEGYFKAVDRSFDSFNASLGYKTNLAQNYHAFERGLWI